MADGMGNTITTNTGLPEPYRSASAATLERISGVRNVIGLFEQKIQTLTEAKLRKRCRTGAAGLSDLCEGISTAERLLQRTYSRNSAGLQQSISVAVKAAEVAAMVPGAMLGIDPNARMQIELDQAGQLLVRAAQATLESEQWELNPVTAKQQRTGDSVMNLAIKKATDLAMYLQKAETTTAREAELAALSDAVAGRKGDVATLMQQHAMRSEIEALGPQAAVDLTTKLFRSAMEADPVDEGMLKRLEAGAMPYIASLTRLGTNKIDGQLQNQSQGTSNAYASGKILSAALQLVEGFRKLRAGRVSPDLRLCADIIADEIAIWQALAGSNALEHLTDSDVRSIYLNGSPTRSLEQRQWLVDPAFLLRGSLGPTLSRSLRQVPNMRQLQSAWDQRTLDTLAGRTRQRGPS